MLTLCLPAEVGIGVSLEDGPLCGRSRPVAYPARVADRRDLSSWLGGTPDDPDGPDATRAVPRGVRLGLPGSGSGALAPLGRRVVALAIDLSLIHI